MKSKTTKAYVVLHSYNPIRWEWFCSPFLNVRMTGKTQTPMGAKRAAERTIKRIGLVPEVEIMWPDGGATPWAT